MQISSFLFIKTLRDSVSESGSLRCPRDPYFNLLLPVLARLIVARFVYCNLLLPVRASKQANLSKGFSCAGDLSELGPKVQIW